MTRRILTLGGAVLALATSVPNQSGAQDLREVRGFVTTARDSSALFGVTVSIPAMELTTVSDILGVFLLRDIPRVPLRVVFTRLGFKPDTVDLRPTADSLRIFLEATALELDPLIATAVPAARRRFDEVAQTSTITIDRDVVQTMPSFIEADVIRAVQLLPGTVAINDFTVGYNARGGEPDQNLIQLDGVQVFNPSHLGGLFSTFDAAAVGDIDYITGGFPAQFGGRLSSILDISLRPGKDRVSGTGQVSLLSSKLLLEGPIPGTNGSVLVGGRRTYADRVADWLANATLPYYFVDGVAKVAVPLRSGGSISVTGYVSRDILDWEFVESEPGRDGVRLEVSWGNKLLGVNVEQPLGGRMFEFHLSASDFGTTIGLIPDIVRIDNTTRVVSARIDAPVTEGGSHAVRAGVGVDDYLMRYDLSSAALAANFLAAAYRPRVWSAYVDDQWQPSDRLMIRPGLRFEAVEGAGFASVAPRIATKWFLRPDLALTSSAGRYYQPVHSLRDQTSPWSFVDFWIGADSVTPVARADHLVLGLEKWFGQGVSLSGEAYRKTFDDILDINFADDPKVQGDEFVPMDGDAWGAELLLRKYAGRVTGWVAYSFGKATRRIGDQEFAPSHDRRHTLNIVIQTRGPLGSDLSMRWGYGSPLPYTDFVGQWRHRVYNSALDAFQDFEEEPIANPQLNSRRYPHYSRLDIGLKWHTKWLGALVRPYLQFVNAYNRGNVFFYVFDYTASPPTREGISQLPLLPSFGVEFEF